MPLLERDEDYLKTKGYKYVVFEHPGEVQLILHDFPIPDVYSVSVAELLIRLPQGYPNANPDMFWTSPTITLKNGQKPRTADAVEIYYGVNWQRWSRHWQDKWRPSIDGLHTYITAIKNELSKGI